MEIDFRQVLLPRPCLPEGYCWEAWNPESLSDHALVKFRSFHEEMDSQIFPALGTLTGCLELMKSIAEHSKFLPQSTWLIRRLRTDFHREEPCGTIQGLVQDEFLGAIQNVAISPEHRGLGLGRALLVQNLHSFQSAGFQRVYLDVSAENQPAVNLYCSLGFRHQQTSYREIVMPFPETA